jgi:CRP/FNR family transcriptional regulator
MPYSELLEALRAVPLGRDLPPPLLEQLAGISSERAYRPRESIVKSDEAVRGIHIVCAGTVLLERPGGRDRMTHKLSEGQSFGELLTLQEAPAYGFDATATEYGTELVEIAAEPFRKLFAEEAELPVLIVGALSSKLMDMVTRVEELSITCGTTRLARHLMSRPRREVGDAHEVDLGIDRKDLASILAITPEHLSRLLRRWADAGLVRPLGRTIALLRLDLLEAMADLDAPEAGD